MEEYLNTGMELQLGMGVEKREDLYRWDLRGVMAHTHKTLFLGVLLLNEYNLSFFFFFLLNICINA